MFPRYTPSPDLVARRQRRGTAHVTGTCGYMASLCSSCHEEEREAMLAHARAHLPAPLPGEGASDYWHRMGQPFYDPWYEVARAMGALP